GHDDVVVISEAFWRRRFAGSPAALGRSLQTRSLGFGTQRILTAVLVLPANRYPGLPQSVSFLEQLMDRLRARPGVEAVGLVNTLPLTGMNARRPYQVPGRPECEQVGGFRIVTPR